MSTKIEEIKNAYYLERLSNSDLSKKFELEDKETSISNLRVYKMFAPHLHKSLLCEYCDSHLISNFVGKNAETELPDYELSLRQEIPQKIEINHSHIYTQLNAILTKELYKISYPFCPSCKHQPSRFCKCSNCSKLKFANYQNVISQKNFLNNIDLALDRVSPKECLSLIHI